MKRQLNWLSIALLFVLVLGGVFVINIILDLRTENNQLTQELNNIEDANAMNSEVFQKTESYLNALMQGDAARFLTDRYRNEAEQYNTGSSHTTADLEELDIYNISVRPQDDGTYLAYAIYLAQLGGVDTEVENPAHYRSMLLTTKITFVEEDGEMKVDDSQLQPIQTSADFFQELLQGE